MVDDTIDFSVLFRFILLPLTSLADAQGVLRGVEHLVLILFIDDLALSQVRCEFSWVQDARELVSPTLHALPQLLTALLRPGG